MGSNNVLEIPTTSFFQYSSVIIIFCYYNFKNCNLEILRFKCNLNCGYKLKWILKEYELFDFYVMIEAADTLAKS